MTSLHLLIQNTSGEDGSGIGPHSIEVEPAKDLSKYSLTQYIIYKYSSSVCDDRVCCIVGRKEEAQH